jgi:hypothetical protein
VVIAIAVIAAAVAGGVTVAAGHSHDAWPVGS